MNAKRVNAAAGVIHGSQVKGKRTATGIAADLEAACLLQSPETVAEQQALQARLDKVERAYVFDVAELRRENDKLRARVAELEAAAEEIQRLHCDSPMGPCPVCIDADADGRGEDPTIPYPCPTARLAGAKDCAPPDRLVRTFAPVAALREDEPQLRGRALLDALTVERAEKAHTKRLGIEDTHDSPLHHAYRLGRDMPQPGVPSTQVVREDEPAAVCRCDEPDADPYSCEAEPEDCSGEFPELNPFGGGPVEGRDAKVSRRCDRCGWETSVWHVDDGSAEEELHGHVTRVHGAAP